MNYLVKTNGDPLNVRQTANGAIVGTITNGTIVTILGKPVNLGGHSWLEIKPMANIPSDRQWVASQYLVATTSSENFHTGTSTPITPTPTVTNQPAITKAKIVATASNETIGGGLYIYYAELIDQAGNIIDTVRCVSGRTWNQIPSHANGSQSPLPFGIYTFDLPGSVEYLGGEFGGVWSGITATFPTERNALGVHFDPSAFAYDDNTGTSGCLATVTEAERDIMTDFILKYRPTHLIVQEA
jgi:hypothetical protein